MDDKWRRVRELFDSALRLAPEERRDFLVREGGGDASLLAEVESLLSSLDGASGFLDKPLFEAPTEQIEAFPEGRIIGHYKISRKIGAGGMGEVYLAKDSRLERSIALKILPEKFATDAERMQRFVREAKSAS